jgi:hypothetical protein
MRLALLLLMMSCAPVAAGELSFGLGRVGLEAGGAPGLAVDGRGATFARIGRTAAAPAAGIELDADGDAWFGLGAAAIRPLGRAWRLEASFMAGLYARASGQDLGGPLLFRTTLGAARRIGSESWLGVTLGHKSNGGLGDVNPGENTVRLTVSRAF